MSSLSRRGFLVAGAAASAAVALPATESAAAPSPEMTYPFTLGVASGDPEPDGVVLWTRLAVNPTADDGRGGMPDRHIPVLWEVASDERFSRIVRRGITVASPDWGHSVHVELHGLRPGREYWYRFRVGRHLSGAGRTVTAPSRDSFSPMTMASISCSMFEHGWFTNYRHLAEERPDLVLHLGDYQYEYVARGYPIPSGPVREHLGPETETIENYRQRYAQYRTDEDLQAAHATAPWLVVFDDHELDNNWADMVPEKPEIPQPNFPQRRAAAFKAYYENMPLRRAARPHDLDIRLYRRIRWGRLANFHMLDTRQYRDDQACGDSWKVCSDHQNPARSLTREHQEQWLIDGFRRSRARWDIVGQQVFFAQRRHPDNKDMKHGDAWDGYSPSRDRILKGWTEADARNLVVLTGDVHAHWGCDIKENFDDPNSKNIGTELVCTSISSGGDGADVDLPNDPWIIANPHIKYHNTRRGYVMTKITKDSIAADYKGVDYVSQKGAPLKTRASYVIEDRNPGLDRVSVEQVPEGRVMTREENIAHTIWLETAPNK